MVEYQDDPGIAERQEAREEDCRGEYAVAKDAKAFLIARTHEYVKVPIVSGDEVQAIEIRKRLSKTESKNHKDMFGRWERAMQGDKTALEDAEEVIASFLAYITKDPTLDNEFWLSEELDTAISDEILLAYFSQPAIQLARIIRFR
ncbi:hypothetical protein [Methanococcoides sp. FTZ1]|uniref:hypothetical protein n=1 Tax=Methanococcoides sp. FTZ1 TaxID=3439061 RepID=UPI003F83AFF7